MRNIINLGWQRLNKNKYEAALRNRINFTEKAAREEYYRIISKY